jgi:hypothetical protein
MQFLELPVGDIAYFILRLVLSGLAAAAAAASFRYARDATATARSGAWPAVDACC